MWSRIRCARVSLAMSVRPIQSRRANDNHTSYFIFFRPVDRRSDARALGRSETEAYLSHRPKRVALCRCENRVTLQCASDGTGRSSERRRRAPEKTKPTRSRAKAASTSSRKTSQLNVVSRAMPAKSNQFQKRIRRNSL